MSNAPISDIAQQLCAPLGEIDEFVLDARVMEHYRAKMRGRFIEYAVAVINSPKCLQRPLAEPGQETATNADLAGQPPRDHIIHPLVKLNENTPPGVRSFWCPELEDDFVAPSGQEAVAGSLIDCYVLVAALHDSLFKQLAVGRIVTEEWLRESVEPERHAKIVCTAWAQFLDNLPEQRSSKIVVERIINAVRHDLVEHFPATSNSQKDPPAAAPARLRFDDLTQVVHLDEHEYKIAAPKAYLLYKILAEMNGLPITQAKIRENSHSQLRGDKVVGNLRRKLPRSLDKTIKSGPNGFWLQLPTRNKIRT